MSEILRFIILAAMIAVVVIIGLRILKVTAKTVLVFFLNAAVGIGAVFLLNLIPGVSIPIVWWTAIVAGVFGLPGVLAILVIGFFL